jgi:hypothetical protein
VKPILFFLLSAACLFAQAIKIGDRVDVLLVNGAKIEAAKIHDVTYDSIMVISKDGAEDVKRDRLSKDFQSRISWPAPPAPKPAPIALPSSPQTTALATPPSIDKREAPAPREKPADPVISKPKREPFKPFPVEVEPVVTIDLSPMEVYKNEIKTSILTRKIYGQVFVVTRGGTNYKLGDVRIELWPRSVSNFYSGQKAQRLLATKPLRDFYDKMSSEGDHKAALQAIQKLVSYDKQIEDLIPEPEIFSYTDADGKYIIEHKIDEPFIIKAKASREIGDETERYTWIIDSDEIPQSGQLMLSNRNIL